MSKYYRTDVIFVFYRKAFCAKILLLLLVLNFDEVT